MRAEACARYGDSSYQEEQETSADLEIIINSHLRTQADVRLMTRCYNTTYIDAAIATLATTLPPTDTRFDTPVSEYLSDPACQRDLDNVNQSTGVFRCEVLPDCNLQCNDFEPDEYGNEGPGSKRLEALARDAMCEAEEWVHAFVLRTVPFC